MEFDSAEHEAQMIIDHREEETHDLEHQRAEMARSRKADVDNREIRRNGPMKKRRSA
jgi:hypothetical protein